MILQKKFNKSFSSSTACLGHEGVHWASLPGDAESESAFDAVNSLTSSLTGAFSKRNLIC